VTPEGFTWEAEVALGFVLVDAGDGQRIEGASATPRSKHCRGARQSNLTRSRKGAKKYTQEIIGVISTRLG
jgi:hypothetical protein